jgi:hypothetical protein
MKRVAKCFDLGALSRSQCLHTATAENDIESVQRLLRAGVQANQQDDFYSTPLHIAAWRGDVEIAQMLLKHGAQANEKRMDGRTPLDLAELRLRGVGDTPVEGLPVASMNGNYRDVAALLREATEGEDVVLHFDLEQFSTGDAMFVCTSIGGVRKASLRVDPETEHLFSVQEALARHLNVSQARLRLVKQGAMQLPTEAENGMTLAQLFQGSPTQNESLESLPIEMSSLGSRADHKKNLALNDLSVLSLSTCASEEDLTLDTPPEHPCTFQ